jgi:hypothetical protein
MKSRPLRFLNEIAGDVACDAAQIQCTVEELRIFAANAYMCAAIHEGHAPAADIKRLLAQKPHAIGLAVPSMPPGSPGMKGSRSLPCDVLLVQGNGSYALYHHYNGS